MASPDVNRPADENALGSFRPSGHAKLRDLYQLLGRYNLRDLYKVLDHYKPLDRWKLLFRLQILAAIGCFLIVLYALRFWNSGEVLRIVGVAALVGGASLSTGFLLGFIFGIPRVGSEEAKAKETAEQGIVDATSRRKQPNSVRPNSNLIEISDWLTKIMVGVGLVELNSIPGKLGRLSYYLGPALRPAQFNGSASPNDLIGSGQAMGLAVIVFYFALGFMLGYVWTRLYFERDLAGLVENLQQDNEELLEELRREKQVTELILKAEQLLNEGDLEGAMDCTNEALAINPQDGPAAMTKARVLKRKAMNGETPDKEKKELLSRALDYATRAVALMPGKGEPIYNRACYQALLGFDRTEVLSSLRSAFSLKPTLRALAVKDTDLESMQKDADFVSLTGQDEAS